MFSPLHRSKCKTETLAPLHLGGCLDHPHSLPRIEMRNGDTSTPPSGISTREGCLDHSHPLSHIKMWDGDTSTPPSGVSIWGGCLDHPRSLPRSKRKMETLAHLHLAFQHKRVVSTTLAPSLTLKCKTEGPVPTSTPSSGISMQGRVVLTTLTLSLTQNARQRH